MRNIIMLVCYCLAVSSPAFADAAAGDSVSSERALREECSAYSEAGMRDCLVTKVQESQKALKKAAAQAEASLSRWDEDTKYINLAKTRLSASGKEFARYREAQCAFAAAIGGGAIGNALDIRRLACEAELNSWRAEQLRNAVADMPLK